MNQLTETSVTILLEPQAHKYAQQFASEQENSIKGKQVYLNTLAAYGVHTYLKCLDIKSDLAHSQCWQPNYRSLFNIADLTLPDVGKLECRYLLPEESEVNIPLETRDERIGYLVVQLEAELQQINLVGFISPQQVEFDTEAIAISQLQPLETLFSTIERLQSRINLRQWLADTFTPDWQPVDLVLAGRITRSLATTNPGTTVTRGKTIQWQLNSLEREIILVLRITKQSNQAIDLCLQLYPGGNSDYLPTGLLVEIIDQANQSCLSAQAQANDDWMQLEFSCQQGEQFQVAMDLDGVSIVEYFSV
ncbi:MAG: DUF1822 family protein [Cyanobacteria bacterium J06621_12]